MLTWKALVSIVNEVIHSLNSFKRVVSELKAIVAARLFEGTHTSLKHVVLRSSISPSTQDALVV